MRRRQAKIGPKIILMDISKPMGTGLETATDMGQEKTESRQDEFVLNWPSVFALPEVISSEDYEKKTGQNWTKDYSNGHIQANGNGVGNGYRHGTREDRKSV